MRPRRWPVWLQGLCLSTLVFLVGYALVSLKTQQEGEKNPGRPTTHSAGMLGYKALYTWLKNLGIQIERWEKPLRNLTTPGGRASRHRAGTGPDSGRTENSRELGEERRSSVSGGFPAQSFHEALRVRGGGFFIPGTGREKRENLAPAGPVCPGRDSN